MSRDACLGDMYDMLALLVSSWVELAMDNPLSALWMPARLPVLTAAWMCQLQAQWTSLGAKANGDCIRLSAMLHCEEEESQAWWDTAENRAALTAAHQVPPYYRIHITCALSHIAAKARHDQ